MPITEVLRPTGDATIEWSIYPASPTTHYDKVYEAASDDDAAYIYPAADGNKDFYTKGTIASGTPLSVRVKINARRVDTGTSDVNLTLKSGAALNHKSVTINVTTYTVFTLDLEHISFYKQSMDFERNKRTRIWWYCVIQ